VNGQPTRAVLLDALGTLVDLEPPWTHLATALGIPEDEHLVRAVRAEMAYYRDHAHEGRDERSLADLRQRCAAVLGQELGREIRVPEMMGAIRFRPYEDAAPALASLRGLGLKLVCVSNWDVSLPDVLERCGLGGAIDATVTSAGSGSRKPDPAIFESALKLVQTPAEEAVHVGDTPEEDIAGARAAGIRALLLDRGGAGDISSLLEIERRLQG
jgi:putative hydrolase of the HAD superfamily